MIHSDSLDQLAPALIAFQSEMPVVTKSETAEIPTRNGGRYSYKYADIVAIDKVAQPILAKNGLAVTQFPGDGSLWTVILHSSGQFIGAEGTIGVADATAQALGSAITYMRRYAKGAALGIVTDEDDDGAAASTTSQRRGTRTEVFATDAQIQKLVVLMKDMDRGERLRYCSAGIGREIGSSKELTISEASMLIDSLENK